MDGIPPNDADRAAMAAVEETRARIAGHVRATPLISVRGADLGVAVGTLWIKLEHLQQAATYKARPVMAALLERRAAGAGLRIAVASKGNGGVALAWAASRLGLQARVFVPEGVSPAKIARIRGYGAEIAFAGPTEAAVVAAKRRWAQASGAVVLASDSRAALLGCATLGSELAEAAAIDTVLVPVGSGALIAGLALAARPGQRLVGVEPLRAPTLARALEAGCPVIISPSGVAADTLGAACVSQRVLEIARSRVARVVAVSDYAIVEAQKALWSELRLLVEPGAAAALAALQSGAYAPAKGERVAIVLTGAND
jgi:threonine dehydratase